MKPFSLLALVLLVGCQTVDVTFEEGSHPEKYFHRAQTAVDAKDYRTALVIFQKFLDTNPTDLSYLVAAEYEVGFLNYKLENNDAAKDWFNKVLARYEDPSQVGALPGWPRTLAQKILGKILGSPTVTD